MRIWIGKGEELLETSGANNAPFSLLKEVGVVISFNSSVCIFTHSSEF